MDETARGSRSRGGRPAGVVLVLAIAASLLLLGGFVNRMVDPLDTGTVQPGRAVAMGILIVTYVAAGSVEWLRSHTRTGGLLVGIALVLATSMLISSREPVAFTLGSMSVPAVLPLFAYLFLSYPEAPPPRRGERVALALAVVGALTVVPVHLFYAPDLHGCGACPPGLNVLLVRPDLRLVRALLAGGSLPTIAAPLAVAYVTLQRYREASPIGRRVRGPLTIAMATFVVSLLVFLVAQVGEPNELSPPQAKSGIAGIAFVISLAVIPLALLLARTRERAAEGVLNQLGTTRDAEDLERAIQRLLGDETAQVGYRDHNLGLRTARGEPLTLPLPAEGHRVATSLGEEVGVLVHDKALLREPRLLEPIVAMTALVVRNQLLAQEVATRLEEVRASQARIVQASDEARSRVERDLHDGAQQRLVVLGLKLADLRQRASDPRLRDEVQTLLDDLGAAMTELRALARGVYPQSLRTDGLPLALRTLADHTPVVSALEVDLDRRFDEPIEAAAYFLVAEAVTNVAKHTTSTAHVRVLEGDGWLEISIEDRGPGGADPAGRGLQGISDRCAALGGELVVAARDGGGTTVRARLPTRLHR